MATNVCVTPSPNRSTADTNDADGRSVPCPVLRGDDAAAPVSVAVAVAPPSNRGFALTELVGNNGAPCWSTANRSTPDTKQALRAAVRGVLAMLGKLPVTSTSGAGAG